jgi:DNA (cytosine-5)-methyltransferase 1
MRVLNLPVDATRPSGTAVRLLLSEPVAERNNWSSSKPNGSFAAVEKAGSARSIEVFSGAGGLALGLQRAGFSHEVLLEWDGDACTTLRRNANCWSSGATVLEKDIRRVDLSEFKGVDLVGGGPACQPFSVGGAHKGHNDSRNILPHFVRLVETVHPTVFVLENVDGLLRPLFADYFDYVLLQLQRPSLRRRNGERWRSHRNRLKAANGQTGLRYRVSYLKLNAADFGIPQIRRRVFVVGCRSDSAIDFRYPSSSYSRHRLLYEQWVTHDYWLRHGLPIPQSVPAALRKVVLRLRQRPPEGMAWRTVRDALAGLPSPTSTGSRVFSQHVLRPGARAYKGHTGSDLDAPSKTLKAGDHGVPGGENMLRLEDGSVRYFTVRELARLQTFPDCWQFEGTWNSVTRQIGNAVPVDLAFIVGRSLFQEIQRGRD